MTYEHNHHLKSTSTNGLRLHGRIHGCEARVHPADLPIHPPRSNSRSRAPSLYTRIIAGTFGMEGHEKLGFIRAAVCERFL